jgi:hypothetical protein
VRAHVAGNVAHKGDIVGKPDNHGGYLAPVSHLSS